MVVKMSVIDGDEAHTAAWNAKFKIIDGDPGGFFKVETGPNKDEGIITTAKVGNKMEQSLKLDIILHLSGLFHFHFPFHFISFFYYCGL